MNYTTYDSATGKITGTITTSSALCVDTNSYIEGLYDFNKYYIKNGEAVLLPENPSTNFIKYDFDWNTMSWVVDAVKTASTVRGNRNALLSYVDRINPVWYATLTSDQQTELSNYRTALLNVPQQSGFPTTIEWPTKPSWL
jgi:hypothetical protein